MSAYRAHDSTEAALLHVTNCLLGNANEGWVSILTLLDLSAAFDTLDHSILLARLHDKVSLVCYGRGSHSKSSKDCELSGTGHLQSSYKGATEKVHSVCFQ